MRVLLDGNLPRTFAALLPGHRVETIHQLRIIVLRAVRNSLPVLAPLAPAVLGALAQMAPGEVRIVGG